MVHVSFYRNYGKTFKKPRRPYEKERLDAELKLVGEYGLRCKRELWRVQYALSRIRNAARMLLTLDEKNSRRIFEGEALLRRMNRYGLLDESQNKLDYVLALTVENFLERRLQTLVFKSGMAKSIHHARVLIRQRHIRIRFREKVHCSMPATWIWGTRRVIPFATANPPEHHVLKPIFTSVAIFIFPQRDLGKVDQLEPLSPLGMKMISPPLEPRVGRQVVNIPSFMVRVDSQKHIDFSLTSPLGGGRPGRVKRRNQKAAAKKAAGGDGDEEDED
ncbi:hypothetical protein HHK36_029766 [Tetracentron sinense]|uniref:Small ribosomal subunit protein uS4 N-terminal domain-containing protein n=1 Tax=Tetracentron sinense TaxID=13715 RepID=A0A835CZM8_TETSI|nr:hypothetical protein HHK36_029766 [Tetracentron sinense]